MANTVRVYIEDTATALATYTSFRLYRHSSPTSTSGTLVDTVAVVAGTENYSVSDASGTPRSWYRISYYTASGPLESEQGPPFQTVGITMRDLRIDAAIRAGVGFKATATGGSTTTLVDSSLVDQGVDTDFMEGSWLYRPDAAAAGDKTRRVARSGFTVATGALTVRDYTNAPVASEEYQAYALMPPVDQPGIAYSWDRAIRQGLSRVRFLDQLDLGPGDDETMAFSLAPHLDDLGSRNITRVFIRTTDTNGVVYDQDASKSGYHWWLEGNGPETLKVRFNFAPTTTETVIVEALVASDALYLDTDATRAPYEACVRAIVAEAYRMMNALTGKYATELAHAETNFLASRDELEPSTRARLW
jgi:hypothetical protein